MSGFLKPEITRVYGRSKSAIHEPSAQAFNWRRMTIQ
eukprot:CAMPEP_0185766722 /NCGR_PEP_ID=MMETSP1174-20130828/38612_1 /TAXON_ID=35687 /ORGANISM="Dictyocha speculum, Strain CCMP1381" /LENGTH=36 /DNA_ID= /DNA_START= /DNA_END= /DNA_ORIENTATION=